ETTSQAGAQLVRGRAGQVVVYLLSHQVDLNDLAQGIGNVGRRLWLSLQPVVAGIIHSQGVVESQPGCGDILQAHVTEHPVGDRRADGDVGGEERVVVAPARAKG